MPEAINMKELENARLDAHSLEIAVNGSATEVVTTRTGKQYPSISGVIKQIKERGLLGAKSFLKYSDMTADDSLSNGDYAIVTKDTHKKNGAYVLINDDYILTDLLTDNTTKNSINKLRDALVNPFADVNIKLIGDSITWGVGASNASSRSGSNKTLADPRNTISTDSPSWANLLRHWLVKSYTDSEVIDETHGTGYGSTHNHITLSAHLDNISVIDTRSATYFDSDKASNTFSPSSNSALKTSEYINLYNINTTATNTVATAIEMIVQSKYIDIHYATLSFGNADDYYFSIYVDDVLYRQVSTFGTAAFNNIVRVNLADTNQHTIRIVNDGVQNSIVRLQHVSTYKIIRVSNDGISGSATEHWLSSIPLNEVITDDYNFIFLQLGTNDRIRTSNRSLRTYAANMRQIITSINQLSDNNANIILMCANAVTQDENPDTSSYQTNMRQIHETIQSVAKEFGLPLISHYPSTNQLKIDGVTYLDDGLHPNDTGYRLMFDNIRDAILTA